MGLIQPVGVSRHPGSSTRNVIQSSGDFTALTLSPFNAASIQPSFCILDRDGDVALKETATGETVAVNLQVRAGAATCPNTAWTNLKSSDTSPILDCYKSDDTILLTVGPAGVGIGGAANGAALLDLTSTTKAFRAPQMTTTQRDAIGTPVAGLLVYNTTTSQYEYHNGAAWGAVSVPTSLSPAVILAPTSSTRNVLQGNADATKPFVIKQFSGTQSANLIEFQDSAGTAIAAIGSAGRTYAPDGTVALPGVSFLAGTAMGLYRIGANILGIGTAATERVRIDASGRIGIGAVATDAQLQVTTTDTARLPIRVQGMVGQTERLLACQNSAGVDQFSVGPDGNGLMRGSMTCKNLLVNGGVTGVLNVAWSNLKSEDSAPILNLYNSADAAMVSVASTGLISQQLRNATTAAQDDVTVLRHNSSGTPAAGFGGVLHLQLESSTTEDRDAGDVRWQWVVATDATRTARLTVNAFDTASREILRGEASGTAPMIGFLGAAAVARSAAYTVTNVTTDRSYDANATTIDELADVLGTLIAQLQSFGLLG